MVCSARQRDDKQRVFQSDRRISAYSEDGGRRESGLVVQLAAGSCQGQWASGAEGMPQRMMGQRTDLTWDQRWAPMSETFPGSDSVLFTAGIKTRGGLECWMWKSEWWSIGLCKDDKRPLVGSLLTMVSNEGNSLWMCGYDARCSVSREAVELWE